MARILMKWLLVAAAFLFLSSIAKAEMLPCASHDDLVSLLAKQYKETPEAIGITQDGTLLEVFVSEQRSWTVLLTTATGVSCIAASGENWERERRKPEAGL
ncbi:hypothetical protein [Taklimakanibacter albus]|uniref:Uncharacterized protein n=1 Tax=Taklimakanibacter albus TaxID=2800327 RepID=A0ACC5R7X8_9HYPH|nr:hypothetical protein [Aestuariivirga sp. YIM B02566]MBK1868769.1 hypothetical protein [Aestuariivirga sp. YIM B02566]